MWDRTTSLNASINKKGSRIFLLATFLTAEQLSCLASPVRSETFTVIRSLGEASVREVAESMDRSPEAVQYHVRALLRVGLIVEKFRRPTGHKPESVYAAATASIQLPDLKTTPELAPLTRKAVVAGLRQTIRGYQAAAEAAEQNPRVREGMSVIRATLRLRPDDAEVFFSLIEKALHFAKANESPDGTRLYWSSIVHPDPKSL